MSLTQLGLESFTVKSFVLERAEFYVQQYLPLEPTFRNNFSVSHYVDEMIRTAVLHFRTAAVKGEVVDESRGKNTEYTFDVFQTWFDHLKYDIREGRVLGWLPISWRKKLTVRYQKVTKTRYETFPVKVTKVCPHADVKFEKNPNVHIAFLGKEIA